VERLDKIEGRIQKESIMICGLCKKEIEVNSNGVIKSAKSSYLPFTLCRKCKSKYESEIILDAELYKKDVSGIEREILNE
jgi:uncharacterized CHY-type Zn-finger protein